MLENPSPSSGNVSKYFLGVPGGEKVQWDGRYQLGVDDAGKDVVYYHVSWAFNGTTYWGWIPNKYLAPEVKHWDPSAGIPGDFSSPTFGYGKHVDGWIKYHTYGEAQFLNLKPSCSRSDYRKRRSQATFRGMLIFVVHWL